MWPSNAELQLRADQIRARPQAAQPQTARLRQATLGGPREELWERSRLIVEQNPKHRRIPGQEIMCDPTRLRVLDFRSAWPVRTELVGGCSGIGEENWGVSGKEDCAPAWTNS